MPSALRALVTRRTLLKTLLALPLAHAAGFDPRAGAITTASAQTGSDIPPVFRSVWDQTDRPVLELVTARTWMWGMFRGSAISEPYLESPGGQRIVQYTDKSRMEITEPQRDPTGPWYVTNGLLVRELMTGALQLGHATVEQREPSALAVAGDDSMLGPSYATLGTLMSARPNATGAPIIESLKRDGRVGVHPSLAKLNVTAGPFVDATGHCVADVFWVFMNAHGITWTANTGYHVGRLFADPFYATGLPLTEPYWTEVPVASRDQLVLVQAFERRVLTYTPQQDEAWRVEAANVGAHYYEWRYGSAAPAGSFPELVARVTPTTIRVGASVEGRPIDAYVFGNGPRIVVGVGGIHTGVESHTVELVEALASRFTTNPEIIPANVTLLLVPVLNVDGLALGTRVNANQVDLNRNWPKGWQRWAYHDEEIVSGGEAPLSEPETAALYAMLDALRPELVISWHSQYRPLGVAEGNDTPLDPSGRPVGKQLAMAYADAAGIDYLDEWTLYPITGQLIDAMEELGVPAFDVELASDDSLQFEESTRGLTSVLQLISGELAR